MKKILIVDDDAAHLTLIEGLLRAQYKVFPVVSGEIALQLLTKLRPDLILLDINMPDMSGISFIRQLKSDKRLYDIPVIFLTIITDTDSEAHALELGAVDYIHKPVNDVVLAARVRMHLELQSYRQDLEKMVCERTSQVEQLQKITIDLLGSVSEFRDRETGYHLERSGLYVAAILDAMAGMDLPPQYHIPKPYYEDIKKSAPLHDLGKISIPDSIVFNPGKLTYEEFETMKTHVEMGAELLKRAMKQYSGPSLLDAALEIVMTHHEKWNGTGYPRQLSGRDIPISGRIMALADVYDALTTKRPYKPAFPHAEAIRIIKESSGSHFDPLLVEIFLSIEDEIVAILYGEKE